MNQVSLFDLVQPGLVVFGLVLIRSAGVLLFIPTFGGEVIPRRMRAALAAILALVMTPLAGHPEIPLEFIALLLAASGEFVLGLAMGLMLRMLLMIAELAGEVAGMQMGFAFNRIVNPLSRLSLAVTSQVMGALTLLIFIAIDGHHMMLAGLALSLERAPVGTVLPRFTYLDTLVPLLSMTMVTAVRIAAPMMVALLLTNVSVALLARAAPQLNLFIFAFGLTIGLGMLLTATSMTASLTIVSRNLAQIPRLLAALVGA